MKNYQSSTLKSFLVRNFNAKKTKTRMTKELNTSDKQHLTDSNLFKKKLFKQSKDYNSEYDQSKSKTRLFTPCLITPRTQHKLSRATKYKLLQSNSKLKYLNDEIIDSFILPDPYKGSNNNLTERSIRNNNSNNDYHTTTTDNITVSAGVRSKKPSELSTNSKEEILKSKEISKKFNKLLLANVNKTKIYSLYLNSIANNNNNDNSNSNGNDNGNGNSDSRQNNSLYQSFAIKKSNKVDHLLMRMTMPQECFEEHLTEKDLIPQDKYTKFKRLLLKKRENVVNCLEELKRTQTLNDTLIKVYTAKLISNKYKYKANPI